jgi:hypothetical protein
VRTRPAAVVGLEGALALAHGRLSWSTAMRGRPSLIIIRVVRTVVLRRPRGSGATPGARQGAPRAAHDPYVRARLQPGYMAGEPASPCGGGAGNEERAPEEQCGDAVWGKRPAPSSAIILMPDCVTSAACDTGPTLLACPSHSWIRGDRHNSRLHGPARVSRCVPAYRLAHRCGQVWG